MNEKTECLRCGSTNLVPADLESTGKIYSRPKEAKILTFLMTGVLVDAVLCLDCGHMELVVDAKKARAFSKASCTAT
jgi:predicted nucleic-acid-binding Zn-ribbon protein